MMHPASGRARRLPNVDMFFLQRGAGMPYSEKLVYPHTTLPVPLAIDEDGRAWQALVDAYERAAAGLVANEPGAAAELRALSRHLDQMHLHGLPLHD